MNINFVEALERADNITTKTRGTSPLSKALIQALKGAFQARIDTNTTEKPIRVKELFPDEIIYQFAKENYNLKEGTDIKTIGTPAYTRAMQTVIKFFEEKGYTIKKTSKKTEPLTYTINAITESTQETPKTKKQSRKKKSEETQPTEQPTE